MDDKVVNETPGRPPQPYVLWLVMEEKDGLCAGCERGMHIHLTSLVEAAAGLRERDRVEVANVESRQLADLIATAVVTAMRPSRHELVELRDALPGLIADAIAIARQPDGEEVDRWLGG